MTGKKLKPSRKHQLPPVLAYDLGGTKVAVGVVDARGKILASKRVPVQFEQGKDGMIRQLAGLGLEFIRQYPKITHVGIASAGPLDPARGVLLDPTNMFSGSERLGKVPIAALLSRKLKKTVILENDAAAAILAECWIGAARGYENAMILTLGTGLGTGLVSNGRLVRAGRSLHTEAGCMIINLDDKSARCGCGNYGCAEAYLSGNGFTRRARVKLGNGKLMAADIAGMARRGDIRARGLFSEYAKLMAVAIHNFVAIFSPEIFVFTGSFAQASDLFLEETRSELSKLIATKCAIIDLMPKLALSTLGNNAGLSGGAFVALQSQRISHPF